MSTYNEALSSADSDSDSDSGEEEAPVTVRQRRYRPSPGLPGALAVAKREGIKMVTYGKVAATYKKLCLFLENPHFVTESKTFCEWVFESGNGVVFSIIRADLSYEEALNLKIPEDYEVKYVVDWAILSEEGQLDNLEEYFLKALLYRLPVRRGQT